MEQGQSPVKKSNFRTRTKSKDALAQMAKELPPFKVYIKEFPVDVSEDAINVAKFLEPTHNSFIENLDALRLYRPQLSAQFEHNWYDFMMFLRAAILKINKKFEKTIQDREKKIKELLSINEQLEFQQKGWKDKIEKIEHLRELENSELQRADQELEIVNREMEDIYRILQADMNRIMEYLTTLQKKRSIENEQGSDQIYGSLNNLSEVLNQIESEQKQSGSNLGTMRALIKAMAKTTKTTTGTQVDESQLQTKAGSVFVEGQVIAHFEVADGSSVNISGKFEEAHIIDKLKAKEKGTTHQSYNQKKNIDKPWALTPTLLVFLENMSKDNEAGRVLPWQYMKQVIEDIYRERMQYEQEMISGMVGNAMLFDEFVVVYFLNKHRVRRLAEVKLLEFIISLKYYSRFWIKAELFCNLMDVIKFQPLSDPSDSNNYKLDYYAQHFFFSVYNKLSDYELIRDDDGTDYVATKWSKKLLKIFLFFTEHMNISRVIVKMEKDIRIFNKVECVEFDYVLQLFLSEYFAVKRRNLNQISKAFTKKFEETQGYLSLDEMTQIFEGMDKIYKSGAKFSNKYPIESTIQKTRLYLYSITSTKNTYDINGVNFLEATTRFGFDAPYPFLHFCPKKRKNDVSEINPHQEMPPEEEVQQSPEKSQQLSSESKQVNISQELNVDKSVSQKVKQEKIVENTEGNQDYERQKVNVGVKLFSQHFSLLKELKSYVDIFGSTLKKEKDPEILWKSFNQISLVLQKGCQFMNYPVIQKQILEQT